MSMPCTSVGKTDSVCFFSTLFILVGIICGLQIQQVHAQQTTVQAVYQPGEFSDGDTIDALLSGSTLAFQEELHLVLSYSGFDIDPNSSFSLDLNEGAACPENNCQSEIWVDHGGQQLHVVLTRPGGFDPIDPGDLLLVRGIGVMIDDIHFRKRKPESMSAFVYPNPSGSSFWLDLSEESEQCHVQMMDFLGRTISQGQYQPGLHKLSIETLVPGRYMIQITAGKKRKKIHQVIQ